VGEPHRLRTATHRFALATLVFNLGVIAWGAFVRATGSGAGCGDHWPTCNGAVVPRPEQVETLIEFFHRATSGVALLLTVALLVLAIRAFPPRHRARRAAGAAMIFMIGEAVVGALLVLNHLVADNDSVLRACIMAVHLVNTFLLLGAFVLTWWFARGGPAVRLRGQGVAGTLLGLTLLACLATGASGGIAALGDTLFPAASLAEGLAQDFSPTAHFLVRLRILHPLLALATAGLGVVTAGVAAGASTRPDARRTAVVVGVLFGVQVAAGGLNLLLAAPVWMQLLHLLLADLVWMAVVVLAATTLAVPAQHPERHRVSPTLLPGSAANK
jgi:heme A synthase